jgi:hypothetical protein
MKTKNNWIKRACKMGNGDKILLENLMMKSVELRKMYLWNTNNADNKINLFPEVMQLTSSCKR